MLREKMQTSVKVEPFLHLMITGRYMSNTVRDWGEDSFNTLGNKQLQLEGFRIRISMDQHSFEFLDPDPGGQK